MKWYAETPHVRARQLVLDLLVLIWVVFFVRLGMRVHDTVLGLREPGVRLEDAGNSLAGSFDSAADRIDGAPLVGGRLRAPFDAAANAGRDVANAGASGQNAVERLALILGLLIALVPIVVMVGIWLPRRLTYAREAGAAARMRTDTQLMALRAASRLPLARLATLAPDTVSRWRGGDQEAALELARLELATLGLRVQPPAAGLAGQGASTGRSPS